MADVTGEMAARQTLKRLLRTIRRHQRGEWKWLLLAVCSVLLLIILIHTERFLQDEQVRVVQVIGVRHLGQLSHNGVRHMGELSRIDVRRLGEVSRGGVRHLGQLSHSGQLSQMTPTDRIFSELQEMDATFQIVPADQRLQYYEQRVTESYLHIQLALANTSGSLATPSGPVLLNKGTLRDLRTFQPLLTAREKARLLYAFELFSTACQVAGLTYFLLDNSLVGSVRHHGVIPWTDVTISVGMRKEDQNRVLNVLDSLEGATLFWPNPYEWSLRLEDVRPDPPNLVRMTFVHILFYRENATHIWGETWGGKRTFTSPINHVFPLVKRLFEGWLVPTPCDVTSVVASREFELCRVWGEDEWEMEWRDMGDVPCDVLLHVFPFVTRNDESFSPTAPSTYLSVGPFGAKWYNSDTREKTVTEKVYVNGSLLYSVDVQTGCNDFK